MKKSTLTITKERTGELKDVYSTCRLIVNVSYVELNCGAVMMEYMLHVVLKRKTAAPKHRTLVNLPPGTVTLKCIVHVTSINYQYLFTSPLTKMSNTGIRRFPLQQMSNSGMNQFSKFCGKKTAYLPSLT